MSKQKTFYRDPKRGKIGGVCSGLANHFGWELWLVRIAAVTAVLLMPKLTLAAYIITWLATDKQPKESGPSLVSETVERKRTEEGHTVEVKTRVWQAGEPPKQALTGLVKQFEYMESSVQDMERYVTSSEYRVRQEFNRL